MKDGNAEDTRNLLPVDDAANECVPQEWNGRTMQFSNFHPAIHPRRSSNRASLRSTLYGLPTPPFSRPLSSATRTIIKHVDSRPVVNLTLFYPYPRVVLKTDTLERSPIRRVITYFNTNFSIN